MKDSFKVQDRPKNMNVTEYNMFIHVVSDFILQLVFKLDHVSGLGVNQRIAIVFVWKNY